MLSSSERNVIMMSAGVAYAAMTLVTFIVYGIDKSRAAKGTWRIRESHLHALEFLFGWPGAIAGMKVFKHKRQKKSFVAVVVLVVMVHIAAWSAWLYYGSS